MSKLKIISLLLLCVAGYSQNKYTVSGVVRDVSSNESIMGATVTVSSDDYSTGVVTNEYGFYSITAPQGTYQVTVSYLGFQPVQQTKEFNESFKINFDLQEQFEELEEVELVDKSIEKTSIRKPQMSVNGMTSETIKSIVTPLGEADVIKSLLTLPGVTNGGETSAGFNVRGGGTDENLVLLDESTLFNTSHLFGFISIFNPEAVKDLKLYKGGIPSRYGGRTSSVLEVYQKEGNSKKIKGSGGVSFLSNRFMLEGPIKKEKGSFLVAGRGAYIPIEGNTVYFYDLNTKLSYRLNENNKIYMSGYFGRDQISFSSLFKNTYGNSLLNFRWNHLFNDKLFSNMSAIYSDYFYGLNIDSVGFQWDSNIRNVEYKYNFKYYMSDKMKLYFGINNIFYAFNPGQLTPTKEDSVVRYNKLTDKYANEFAAYVGAEHKITDKLTMEYGLRLSRFDRLGQDLLYLYKDDNPVDYNPLTQVYSEGKPIDSIVNQSIGQSIADYTNLEPRLSLSYVLNDNTSLKASYNRMAQYIQIVSNANSPTPLDIWTPSGRYFKPMKLDQYAVGVFKKIKDGAYTLELEGYYKHLANKVDYINGANLVANNSIERTALSGIGRSYGLEMLFKKQKGNLTGWVSYTLSRSEQKITGKTDTEVGINNRQWYATPYNRTHVLSFTGSYKIASHWTFNTFVTYQTGRATTFPTAQYEYQKLTIPSYSDRNSDTFPAYHRLDISFRHVPKKYIGAASKKKFKQEWVFSIYNLYNHKNANSISFKRNNEEEQRNVAEKIYIFGIVPSVTWNFKF